MFELWGRKCAYNVQKVIWALHELDLEYRHHDVGSTPADLHTEDFISKNLHSRIPVLSYKNEYIWESNTIVRFLSCSYGRGSLWDEDPLLRSRAERWMDWELSTLQPDFIDLFWSFYRTPVKQRNAAQISNAKHRCEDHFQKLDQHLKSNSYVAGETFTMGDISCATALYRYFSMGLNVKQPLHLLSWYKRLSKRTAYQKNIMIPYNNLQGRVTF